MSASIRNRQTNFLGCWAHLTHNHDKNLVKWQWGRFGGFGGRRLAAERADRAGHLLFQRRPPGGLQKLRAGEGWGVASASNCGPEKQNVKLKQQLKTRKTKERHLGTLVVPSSAKFFIYMLFLYKFNKCWRKSEFDNAGLNIGRLNCIQSIIRQSFSLNWAVLNDVSKKLKRNQI